MALPRRYTLRVPSVQIKNVPDDVHAVLRRRAAASGQSLQEYLLARLTDDARHDTVEEVLERAAGRAGGSVPLSFAARTLRSERERR
jgi:antitoxin FitA